MINVLERTDFSQASDIVQCMRDITLTLHVFLSPLPHYAGAAVINLLERMDFPGPMQPRSACVTLS
jgi:hypothetical protein